MRTSRPASPPRRAAGGPAAGARGPRLPPGGGRAAGAGGGAAPAAGPGGRGRAPATDPFRILGLEPSPDLSDEDVRGAWRRAATGTHPDREDGGDPERFAAAAAAYTTLRTRSGRGEALADLSSVPAPARETGRPRFVLARPPRGLTRPAAPLAGRAPRRRPRPPPLPRLAPAPESTSAL